jgi:phage-related protein
MKHLLFHPKARVTLKEFSCDVRRELGKLLFEIQCGVNLTMPASKPMPSIAAGVEELRTKDASGIYRVFYFKKSATGILVFHAFTKKTQKTPLHEIKLGQQRLKEMLE